MKSKPKQTYQPKMMQTEQLFKAMCRQVEKKLVRHGATPSEVALLRNVAGNGLTSAVAIGLMKARIQMENVNLADCSVGMDDDAHCNEDDRPVF